MRKNSFIILIFVLISASILSVVINFFVETDGLLMNLATEIIGIVITLIFVDKIIKNYETEKWIGIDRKMKKYIQVLINATVSSVRGAFGLKLQEICSFEVFNAVLMKPKENFYMMEEEIIRISKEILEPTAHLYVVKMSKDAWNTLISNFKNVYESAGTILSLFGPKLSPLQFELLLDVQETINGIFVQHQTWPDIIAVPDEKLPVNENHSTVDLKHEITKQLSEDIRNLLSKIRDLYRTIEKDR